MRKFTLVFTAALVFGAFSNEILAKSQPQNFNMSIFSFVQSFFDTKPTVPFKKETEMTLHVQPVSWLDYFIFQKDWFEKAEKKVIIAETNKQTPSKDEGNTVISEKETTKTTITPTSTIVVTKTSKITTKPETVNIGEMMLLLEEVGAGASY